MQRWLNVFVQFSLSLAIVVATISVATFAAVPLAHAQQPSAAPATAADEIPPAALKTPKFDKAYLAPVDGISVRQYAHIVFDMFANDEQDTKKLLAKYGLTQARFDTINAAMIKRMQDDQTRKFIDIYGAYYIEEAPGQFAKLARDVAQSVLSGGPLREREPMTWKEYMKFQGYYARKAPFARDTSRAAYDDILSDQGMNFIDFQVLGAWFGRQLALQ